MSESESAGINSQILEAMELAKQGEQVAARDIFHNIPQEAVEDLDNLAMLGKLAMAVGERIIAINIFNEIVENRSGDIEYMLQLAQAYMENNMLQMAAKWIDAVLIKDPESQKYGNKKTIVNGVKFDSKLEQYMYGYLELVGADFDFQKKIILVDKFRFNDKGIRATTLTVDFVVRSNGKTLYVDTKGFATEVAKLKYKLLRHQLKDEENVDVVWLKNKKEVNNFIKSLI